MFLDPVAFNQARSACLSVCLSVSTSLSLSEQTNEQTNKTTIKCSKVKHYKRCLATRLHRPTKVCTVHGRLARKTNSSMAPKEALLQALLSCRFNATVVTNITQWFLRRDNDTLPLLRYKQKDYQSAALSRGHCQWKLVIYGQGLALL